MSYLAVKSAALKRLSLELIVIKTSGVLFYEEGLEFASVISVPNSVKSQKVSRHLTSPFFCTSTRTPLLRHEESKVLECLEGAER